MVNNFLDCVGCGCSNCIRILYISSLDGCQQCVQLSQLGEVISLHCFYCLDATSQFSKLILNGGRPSVPPDVVMDLMASTMFPAELNALLTTSPLLLKDEDQALLLTITGSSFRRSSR